MPHKLITGTSLSGKSTLARRLAALYTEAGMDVIVLDEMMEPAWIHEGGAKFLTDDPEEFKRIFWASRRLAVFIDEAGESVGRYDKTMSMTATRGRHWGHICHYIVQQPAMISRQVRGQCAEAYVFASDEDDAEMLSKTFLCPELKTAPTLARGSYLHAIRFGKDNKPQVIPGKVF